MYILFLLVCGVLYAVDRTDVTETKVRKIKRLFIMCFYETKNVADPALTLCTHMLLEEFFWIALHIIEIFQIRLALDLYTHQMLEVELPFTNPFRSNCLNVFLNILIFFWYIIVLYPQL